MGIAADWARIKGNILDAFSAIGDKGVTVPEGSTSNNLAELIAQISSSMKFTSGVYVPASESNSATITHGLGQKPDFFVLYKQSSSYRSDCATLDSYVIIGNTAYASGRIKSASSFGGWVGDVSSAMTSTSVSMNCKFVHSGTTYNAFLMVGKEYSWFAGVFPT